MVNQIGLRDRGDFCDFEALVEAKAQLEVHSDFFLWCRCCGVKLGTRKNVWQKHFRLQSHKDKAAKPNTRQQLLGGSIVDSVAEAAKRQRLADEQVAHRLRMAKMAYSHSISIKYRQIVAPLSMPRCYSKMRPVNTASGIANKP